MTASGDYYKNLIILARTVEHNFQLSQYSDEAALSISKILAKAQKELINEIGMRDIRLGQGRDDAVLKEIADLMYGIQIQLGNSIEDAARIAGESSFREYGKILGFDGKLDSTVGFSTVSVSPAQLKSMIVDTPVGGAILSEWITDIFDKQFIRNIKEEISTGMFRGESTRSLVNRLMQSAEITQREAISLTRTYVADINNRAAKATYDANSDIIKSEKWSATLEGGMGSGRTCIRCAVMDSREFRLDEDHIRPPLHPRCVTADSIIFAPDMTHLTRSKYSGPIIKVTLSDKTVLSVTPNHMLMTEDGLVMARFLTNGDNLLRGSEFKGVVFGNPNDNRNHLRIDNIVKAFSKNPGMISSRMPVSAEDFHGDGVFGDKDVDIIDTNGFLINNINTEFLYHFTSNSFSPVDTARLLSSYRNITLFFKRYLSSTHRSVGLSREFFSFILWCVSHPNNHGLTLGSGLDTIVFQKPVYSGSLNVEFFRKCFCGHTVIEETDSFIRVNLSVFRAFIVENWESCHLKPTFDRLPLHSNYPAYLRHGNTFFVHFMKLFAIEFRLQSLIRVFNSLLRKRSFFNFVPLKNVINRAAGNAKLFRNIRNGLPRFIKANYVFFINRFPLAYGNLLGAVPYRDSSLYEKPFDCRWVGIKSITDFGEWVSGIVKINDFVSKWFNSVDGLFTKFKTVFGKHFAQFLPVNLESTRDTGDTLPIGVETVKITNINVDHVDSIDVYDVSSLSSSYIVNGILSSNCRCVMVPITLSYRELGLDIDELKDAARPWTTRLENNIDAGRLGTITDSGQMTGGFKAFFDKQLPGYQKSLLGPNRYQMLKDGKIAWDDIIDKNGNVVLLKKSKDGGYTGLR